MNQQVRSVRLMPGDAPPHDDLWERGEVAIVGPGRHTRAVAGQTIAQTLRTAGVTPPTDEQTVRVNMDEVNGLNHVLRSGDKLTITNRVRGGGH